jgi:hypothetical protein
MGLVEYKTKYHRLNHQLIIDDYNKLKSIKEVSKIHFTSEALVKKVLVNNNIELPKKILIQDIKPDNIIKRYNEIRNTQIVAKEFSLSASSIQKILHKNGIRVSMIKYSDEEIIKYYQEVKTIDRVCKDLSISDSTVRNVLDNHKVERLTLKRKEIGDIFGKLTIIEETEPKISSGGKIRRQFILQCECGNKVKRDSLKLSSGKSWHCGCVTEERKKLNQEKERIRKEEYQILLLEREKKKANQPKKEPRKKYNIGDIKDRLTILSIGTESQDKRTILCKCECGNIKEMSMHNFYQVKSCGCLQNENRVKASIKHGNAKRVDPNRRKWYDRWRSMIKRCYNPKIKSYSNYGGRGITVCDRWREPDGVGCENYYNDIHNILGPQPSPEHSIDRINNDGPYEITNLRWATNSEQNKNKRYPRKISKS